MMQYFVVKEIRNIPHDKKSAAFVNINI